MFNSCVQKFLIRVFDPFIAPFFAVVSVVTEAVSELGKKKSKYNENERSTNEYNF